MPRLSFSAKLQKRPQVPTKPLNLSRRPREYLTPREVEKCQQAAKLTGRHGHRDATMILIAFRHGLRASELVDLRWEHIDLAYGLIDCTRKKNGQNATHPMTGGELRALRRVKRDYPHTPYVFESERKTPLTERAFHRIVARAGEVAGLPFPVHPHMLRHATGYKLANDGVDTRAIQHYLGHKNIQHTVKYTELAFNRFQGFFRD